METLSTFSDTTSDWRLQLLVDAANADHPRDDLPPAKRQRTMIAPPAQHFFVHQRSPPPCSPPHVPTAPTGPGTAAAAAAGLFPLTTHRPPGEARAVPQLPAWAAAVPALAALLQQHQFAAEAVAAASEDDLGPGLPSWGAKRSRAELSPQRARGHDSSSPTSRAAASPAGLRSPLFGAGPFAAPAPGTLPTPFAAGPHPFAACDNGYGSNAGAGLDHHHHHHRHGAVVTTGNPTPLPATAATAAGAAAAARCGSNDSLSGHGRSASVSSTSTGDHHNHLHHRSSNATNASTAPSAATAASWLSGTIAAATAAAAAAAAAATATAPPAGNTQHFDICSLLAAAAHTAEGSSGSGSSAGANAATATAGLPLWLQQQLLQERQGQAAQHYPPPPPQQQQQPSFARPEPAWRSATASSVAARHPSATAAMAAPRRHVAAVRAPAPAVAAAEDRDVPALPSHLSPAEIQRVRDVMARTAATARSARVLPQPANTKVRANARRLEGRCAGCGTCPETLRSGSATRRNARDEQRDVYYGLCWCNACYGLWARAYGPGRKKA